MQSTYTLQILLRTLLKSEYLYTYALLRNILYEWILDNKFFVKTEGNLCAKHLRGGPRQVSRSLPLNTPLGASAGSLSARLTFPVQLNACVPQIFKERKYLWLSILHGP